MRKFLFKNKTIVSILSLIIIVFGLPIGVYVTTLEGMSGIGGVYILFIVFFVFIIYIIDRFLVRFISALSLNIAELIILFLLIASFEFNERKLVIHVHPDTNYFLLIVDNDNFKNNIINRVLPFDKKIQVKNHHAVIPSFDKINRIKVRSSKNWDSYSSGSLRNHPKIYLYANSNFIPKKSEIEMDSFINVELEKIKQTLSTEL